MPIRRIRKDGFIIAFQAFVGNAGAGKSKYFSAIHRGEVAAERSAVEAAQEMEQGHERPPTRGQGGNSLGFPGLRFDFQRPRSESGVPILYAVATWNENGVMRHTAYSTAKHGRIGAVEKAKAVREKGSGLKVEGTIEEIERRMTRAFEQASSTARGRPVAK